MTNETSVVGVQVVIVATAILIGAGYTTVLFVLMSVLRRTDSQALRVLAVMGIVGAVVSSPGLVEASLVAMNRTSGVARLMIDPGWAIKVAPGMIGAVVAWVLSRRFIRARVVGSARRL